jgi:hypothetical protein
MNWGEFIGKRVARVVPTSSSVSIAFDDGSTLRVADDGRPGLEGYISIFFTPAPAEPVEIRLY